MKKLEKIILKAVYEKDTEKLLKSLGLLEKVKKREIQCFFCSDTVTLENFGGLLRKDGKLRFFCDKIECYLKMLKERRKGR